MSGTLKLVITMALLHWVTYPQSLGEPMNNSFEKFTKFHLALVETEAYRELSLTAKAALPIIKLEWKGAKFNNNGKIELSARQLAEALNCTPNTAAKALQDLQRKGFIFVTEMARLGVVGHGRGHKYELTEHPMVGQSEGKTKSDKVTGRKLYKDWCKGSDFPVAEIPPNNPKGINGRLK